MTKHLTTFAAIGAAVGLVFSAVQYIRADAQAELAERIEFRELSEAFTEHAAASNIEFYRLELDDILSGIVDGKTLTLDKTARMNTLFKLIEAYELRQGTPPG